MVPPVFIWGGNATSQGNCPKGLRVVRHLFLTLPTSASRIIFRIGRTENNAKRFIFLLSNYHNDKLYFGLYMDRRRRIIFFVTSLLWFAMMRYIATPVFAKDQPTQVKPTKCAIKQKVLFQMAYENYAWGYQNRGFFIDNKGIIKYYHEISKEYWRKPDSGYFSKEDLEHNYLAADSIIGKVNKNELCHFYHLIKSASKESLSKNVNTGYDMGANSIVAYLWDNHRKKYKIVFLSVEGDWTQDNLNPNALEITEWLRQMFNRPRRLPIPQPHE